MAEGDYVLPEPTEAQVNDMLAKLTLLNSEGTGVSIDRLKSLFPKVGRAHLLKRLETLKAQGRARSELRTAGGPVMFEFWYEVGE